MPGFYENWGDHDTPEPPFIDDDLEIPEPPELDPNQMELEI